MRALLCLLTIGMARAAQFCIGDDCNADDNCGAATCMRGCVGAACGATCTTTATCANYCHGTGCAPADDDTGTSTTFSSTCAEIQTARSQLRGGVTWTAGGESDAYAAACEHADNNIARFVADGAFIDRGWVRCAFDSAAMTCTDFNTACLEEDCAAGCQTSQCAAQCLGINCGRACSGILCAEGCTGPGCGADCTEDRCALDCNAVNCGKDCTGHKCAATCEGAGCGSDCISTNNGTKCAFACVGANCGANCEGSECAGECVGDGCGAGCVGTLCAIACTGAGCGRDCTGAADCGRLCYGYDCGPAINPTRTTPLSSCADFDARLTPAMHTEVKGGLAADDVDTRPRIMAALTRHFVAICEHDDNLHRCKFSIDDLSCTPLHTPGSDTCAEIDAASAGAPAAARQAACHDPTNNVPPMIGRSPCRFENNKCFVDPGYATKIAAQLAFKAAAAKSAAATTTPTTLLAAPALASLFVLHQLL
jgi:hypothetical protein